VEQHKEELRRVEKVIMQVGVKDNEKRKRKRLAA